MDEERAVLLGVVQERQGVDNASPYVCKAGGTPVRCYCRCLRWICDTVAGSGR